MTQKWVGPCFELLNFSQAKPKVWLRSIKWEAVHASSELDEVEDLVGMSDAEKILWND